MKKMMVLLVIVIPCVLFIQGGVAGAATPKIGAVCMTKNAIAKISGKDSICAVKPSEWNKSHKMYWQDLNAYSSTVDKVIGKLSPADRYQYCLVQNGGPLPGEKGNVPQAAKEMCANLPGSPSSSNSASSSGASSNQPPAPPSPAAQWDAYVSLKYLACLKQNGFEPTSTKDLLQARDTGSHGTALANCKSDQPFYLNR